jgi:hypothetical protein
MSLHVHDRRISEARSQREAGSKQSFIPQKVEPFKDTVFGKWKVNVFSNLYCDFTV